MDIKKVPAKAIKWLGGKFGVGDDTSRQVTVWIGRRPILMTIDEFSKISAHKKDVNLAVAVRLIANSLAQLPIVIEEKLQIDGKTVWEPVDEHPAIGLFEDPTPFNDAVDIKKHIIQSLILDGNSYNIIARHRSLVVNELWPVPVGMMSPSFRKSDGLPAAFIYDPYGAKQRYPIEEILHIKLYDAATPFLGASMVTPIYEQLLGNRYAVQYNRKFFENGASVDLLFANETGIGMDEEDEDRFLKSWDDKHEGVDKSHKRGLLPPGYKPIKVSDTIRDLAYSDGIRLNREQIYAFLGIPPSEGGVYEYANYANALIQKRSYWENTLLPIIMIVESAINRQIIRRYWKEEGLRARLDTSGVRALQEDRLEIAKEDEILVRSGISTINEIRERRDLDPVEWGDEDPRDRMQDDSPGKGESSGKNAIGSGDINFQQLAEPEAIHTDEQRRKWVAFDIKARKYEGPYKAIIVQYFKQQRSRVVKALKALTGDGLAMSFLKIEIDRMDAYAGDNIPKKPSEIFDLTAENKLLMDAIRPFITAKVTEIGIQTIQELNLSVVWDAHSPYVLQTLRDIWNRSQLINETTFEDIRKMLRVAYDENYSTGQLSRMINQVYGEYGKKRAVLVARTEMGSIVNGGSHLANLSAGISEEWITSLDGKERAAHRIAHGQIREAREPFDVGGEKLDYPLDPKGRADNVINCRCAVAGLP